MKITAIAGMVMQTCSVIPHLTTEKYVKDSIWKPKFHFFLMLHFAASSFIQQKYNFWKSSGLKVDVFAAQMLNLDTNDFMNKFKNIFAWNATQDGLFYTTKIKFRKAILWKS